MYGLILVLIIIIVLLIVGFSAANWAKNEVLKELKREHEEQDKVDSRKIYLMEKAINDVEEIKDMLFETAQHESKN